MGSQVWIQNKVTRIIDIGKGVDTVALLNHLQQIRHRENPVGVELNPLFANGNGEVELAAGLKHFVYVLPAR